MIIVSNILPINPIMKDKKYIEHESIYKLDTSSKEESFSTVYDQEMAKLDIKENTNES